MPSSHYKSTGSHQLGSSEQESRLRAYQTAPAGPVLQTLTPSCPREQRIQELGQRMDDLMACADAAYTFWRAQAEMVRIEREALIAARTPDEVARLGRGKACE